MQLARHLNFFIELAKAAEAKNVAMNERAAKAEKELFKAKARASKVEEEFRQQKGRADTLSSNAMHSITKIVEVGKWVATIHWKMNDACEGEARAIVNTRAKVVDLKKKIQAEIKDLKKETNDWIQWFWDELNSVRSQNEWLWG